MHVNGVQGRVVLGARVEDACRGPAEYADALHLFGDRPFALTYRPETQRAYVMLKEGASSIDALCGAFHAHVLLHMMDAVEEKAELPILEVLPKSEPGMQQGNLQGNILTALRDLEDPQGVLLNMTAGKGHQLYSTFLEQAESIGWQIDNTMLNPKEARLVVPQHA